MGKIVTEVTTFEAFYPAEDYHQDYEKNNPDNPYIQTISKPRATTCRVLFPELMK